jgi:hypothetical protein
MKANRRGKSKGSTPAALKALRRAGRKAVELARRTGTPAYVFKDGQIVDIAKQTQQPQRTRRKTAGVPARSRLQNGKEKPGNSERP